MLALNGLERTSPMTVIAINVLLNPDAASVERAQAVNARLRADDPAGFCLDAQHAPHITLFQGFIRQADLDAVADAVAAVLRSEHVGDWQSKAIGFYDLSDGNRALVGLVIEPTPGLRRLQHKVIDAVSPFAVENGTAAAFAPRLDGAAISQPTVDYVNAFVGPRTGLNYNPHLTVGLGSRAFVDALKAEPFEPFAFRPVSVSVYQLGDYGVAQYKLRDLSTLSIRCPPGTRAPANRRSLPTSPG